MIGVRNAEGVVVCAGGLYVMVHRAGFLGVLRGQTAIRGVRVSGSGALLCICDPCSGVDDASRGSQRHATRRGI